MRSGYAGVALILVFAVSVSAFFLSFPNLRFYKDISKRLREAEISLCESPSDCDDFVSAVILSLSVPETTVGMSFDGFRAVRQSREEARRLENAVESSGWKVSSRVLGNMFVSASNGRVSVLVPDLARQIDAGFVSPGVFAVQGDIGGLRVVWDAISGYIAAQTGMSLLDTIWGGSL